jgi:hypothetical protein
MATETMQRLKRTDRNLDQYYSFMRVVYEKLQEDTFLLPGVIYDTINDLRNISDQEHLTNILHFTLNLTYHSEQHIAKLVNSGLLQSLAVRLRRDVDTINRLELYILGNSMMSLDFFV